MEGQDEAAEIMPPYGIRLDTTSKGVRIGIRINGPKDLNEANRKKAIDEAIATFEGTVNGLKEKGYTAEVTSTKVE